MVDTTANERISAFEDRLARAQATDVIELPWGTALLQTEFPLSRYHNRISVVSEVSAAEVIGTCEELLGGAQLQHRYVSTDNDLGESMKAEFLAAGYDHEALATVIYAGPPVEPSLHDVRAVSFETMRPAIVRDWRDTLPDAPEEEIEQLADRMVSLARASELTFVAVFHDEEIAARADVRIDRGAGIALLESLQTQPRHRGLGYGRALVNDALTRGNDAGCDLSFLTASLSDWPYAWYTRLGYVEAGRTHHFSRLHQRTER